MHLLAALLLSNPSLPAVNPNQCSYENPIAACVWLAPLNEGVLSSQMDKLLSEPMDIA